MTGILSLTTFAPILGVAAILILRVFGKPEDARTAEAARWIALITTLATFALSVLMLVQFDRNGLEPGAQARDGTIDHGAVVAPDQVGGLKLVHHRRQA